MTTLVLGAKRGWSESWAYARSVGPWRLGLVAAIVALAAVDGQAHAIILRALADAFLQVSVFVAATMALVYGLERLFGIDAPTLLARHRRWQVPVAAFMGALPGCGGAIMVMTQYVQGRIGFGAMVAVLTATMGDAAFLLLAREPATGLAIFALGIAVGILSGYIVDAIHGPGFLRMEGGAAPIADCHGEAAPPAAARRLWMGLVAIGLVVGVALAFQIDVDAALGMPAGLSEGVPAAGAAGISPTLLLGTTGALLALILWGFMPAHHAPARDEEDGPASACRVGDPGAGTGTLAHIMADTNFVTAWVIFAYLAYGLGVHYTGVDLEALFEVGAPFVPLIAVLVGFLPGCGPQIVVTTLYLSGLAPLSAQIGNAISNDGDALFPAIALAPGAAVIATLYSAIPALLVAYGYYWLWEI